MSLVCASCRPAVGVVLAAVGLALAGCGPARTAYPEALNSHRPEERVLAIKRAGELEDRSVMPILVDRLEDEDEAVRMFAILALERMTGTRLGYQYHAPESERARAAQRWRRHLAGTQPADDATARYPAGGS